MKYPFIITGLLWASLLISQEPACTSVRYLESDGSAFVIEMTIEAGSSDLQSWISSGMKISARVHTDYQVDTVGYTRLPPPSIHLYVIDHDKKGEFKVTHTGRLDPGSGLPEIPAVTGAPGRETAQAESWTDTVQAESGTDTGMDAAGTNLRDSSRIPVPYTFRFEIDTAGLHLPLDSLLDAVQLFARRDGGIALQFSPLELEQAAMVRDTLYVDPRTGQLHKKQGDPAGSPASQETPVMVPDSVTKTSFTRFMDSIQYAALLSFREGEPGKFGFLDSLNALDPSDLPPPDFLYIHAGGSVKIPAGLSSRYGTSKELPDALAALRALIRQQQPDRCTLRITSRDLHAGLEFADTVAIHLSDSCEPLEIPLEIPQKELCKATLNEILLKAYTCLDQGHYARALDTLWAQMGYLEARGVCESVIPGMVSLAEEAFIQYCDNDISTDPDPESAYQKLIRVKEQWKGEKSSIVNTRETQVLAKLFNDFWNSKQKIRWNRMVVIGKKIPLSTNRDKVRYNYALYSSTSDPDKACAYLRKCLELDPSYGAAYTRCVQRRLDNAISAGDHAKVYQIGSSEFRYIRESPSHRYGYALAARETGNNRDAYEQYAWFEKNWNSVQMEELTYEECIGIMLELSFSTGNFREAFALNKRNYLNSDLPVDLVWTLCSHRMIYLGMIADSYLKVSRITGKSKLLPNVKDYQPGYVTDVNHPSRKPTRAIYPTSLISYPFSAFDTKSGDCFLLQQLPAGNYLEIIQNSLVPVNGSRELVSTLSSNGYHMVTFNTLFDMEKQASLEFFGTAFKVLLGELLTSSEEALPDFLRSLMQTGHYVYFSYQHSNDAGSVGECPVRGIMKSAIMRFRRR